MKTWNICLSVALSCLALLSADRLAAQNYTDLYNFTDSADGGDPVAGLVLSADGTTLYGTTLNGGSGYGTIFSVKTNGDGFTTLYAFMNGPDGGNPQAGLILSPDGSTLYGTAVNGGNGQGTVFSVGTNGTGFTTLYSFMNNGDGANPQGGLVLSSNTLYGTATAGGNFGGGSVFSVETNGSDFAVLYSFMWSSDGGVPEAGLVLSADGTTLDGTAQYGGNGYGTVFSVETNGSDFTTLYEFADTGDGADPEAGLILSPDGTTLYGTTYGGGSAGAGAVFSVNTDGTDYETLYSFSFSGPSGSQPKGGLVLEGDTLYGTTWENGNNGLGSLFSIGTNGAGFAIVPGFSSYAGGANPQAGLIAAGLNLYGTTDGGGSYGSGTVFNVALPCPKITLSPSVLPNGAVGVYYDQTLTASGGVAPYTYALVAGSSLPYNVSLSTNGVLSGQPDATGNYSFKISATDANGCATTSPFTIIIGQSPLSELHDFPTTGAYPMQTNSDGANPTGVFLSGNTLYGAALIGGIWQDGALFAVNTDGTGFTNLYSFSATSTGDYYSGTNSDGSGPGGGVILSGDTLYGTTEWGGASGDGTVFSFNIDTMVFTTLHSFSAETAGTNGDGVQPTCRLVLSGNTLYGIASWGGIYDGGTIFSVKIDGSCFSNLYNFTYGDDGGNPAAGLILSSNTLYGTDQYGGSGYNGTVFSIKTNGTCFTTLYSFSAEENDTELNVSTNGDGGDPIAELVLSGDTLYGTAAGGGTNGNGTVWSLTTGDSPVFTTLYNFSPLIPNENNQPTNIDGAIPDGLTISGNTLYGTAQSGGISPFGAGTVFAINTDGTGFRTVIDFDYFDGYAPGGGLIFSDNMLYGTTQGGGNSGYGTVFGLSTCPIVTIGPGSLPAGYVGNGYAQTLTTSGGAEPYRYTVTEGALPGGLSLSNSGLLSGMPTNIGSFSFTVTSVDANGCAAMSSYVVNTFGQMTVLHSFTNGIDGANGYGGLVLSGNTLYGAASGGGASGAGTVYAVNTDGTGFATLHSFNGSSDGAGPEATLLLSGNTLYGPARYGGTYGSGTVFAVTNFGGGFRAVYEFEGLSDGYYPQGRLTLSGTTLYATAGGGNSYDGTVDAINAFGAGSTTLHTFTGSGGDGLGPDGGVIVSGNILYGTTQAGGSAHYGIIFSVNTNTMSYTTLYNFSAPAYGNFFFPTNRDGAGPAAGLIISGNTLYGVAEGGGTNGSGTVFAFNVNTMVLTTLHSFTEGGIDSSNYITNNDGLNPVGTLVLSGNTLYGTATEGGTSGYGTVFSVNTDGTGFTTLYNFTNGFDGAFPEAGLILVGNILYGAVENGASGGYGAVFALGLGGVNPAVPASVAWNNPSPIVYGSAIGPAQLNATANVPGNFAYNPIPGTVFNSVGVFPVSVIFTPSDTVNYSSVTNTVNLQVTLPTLTVTAHNASRVAGTANPVFTGTITGLVNNDNITATYSTTADYQSLPGTYPIMPALVDPNNRATNYHVVLVNGTLTVTPIVDLFNIVHGFSPISNGRPATNGDGWGPLAGLIASNNVLYGTAVGGGAYGNGTVFSVHTDGSGFTTLHNFSSASGCCGIYQNSDGDGPEGALVLGGNTLYGPTIYGGEGYTGALFDVETNGTTFEPLHYFQNAYINAQNFPVNGDGDAPYAGMVLSNGILYGTTIYGGNNGTGVIFMLDTNGSDFVTLHDFSATVGPNETNTDGYAIFAGLALSGNTLYGTAQGGGTNGGGTVFAVNIQTLAFATLHSFVPGTDGFSVDGTVVLSGDTLYGTAGQGGSGGGGTIYSIKTNGTAFTVLHNFPALNNSTNSDGFEPLAGLILSADGETLYGTAVSGGAFGYGAVYAIGTNGLGFTNIYNFTDGVDGAYPEAGLVLSGFSLYGVTSRGGSSGSGTIYSLTFLPQLSIAVASYNLEANVVVLTWPAKLDGFDFTGFTLQSTTSLDEPESWSNVSATPFVNNGVVTVTVPFAPAHQFFRLYEQLEP